MGSRKTLPAVLLLLLAGKAVLAADLRSDVQTLLGRMASGPGAAYRFQDAESIAVDERDDGITARIRGLTLAPRTGPAAGVTLGAVVIHVRRRADGGIEAAADLSGPVTMRGATPPSACRFDLEDGKLLLGWNADLESDRVVFSAASMTQIGAIFGALSQGWANSCPAP